jgi:signal transduction histidine kinase
MQSRLLAFFLPGFLALAGVLGAALAVESAHRISLAAASGRAQAFARLESAVVAAVNADSPADLSAALAEWSSESDIAYITIDGRPEPPNRALNEVRAEQIERSLGDDATVWPWTDGDFAQRSTFRVGARTVEVVALVSTDSVQAQVARRWTVIIAALSTAIALMAAGTYPLTRWALRPIRQLDASARSLADGDLSTRAAVGRGAPELKQLAASFNAMVERSAAGIHRERAFVASASHHFGNLLTPLRLRIETIGRDDPLVEEALAELDRLESAAERLLQLNHAEESDVQPVVVDVGEIVDDSLESWRVVTESLGVELCRQGSVSSFAWAVPGAIDESLDNLIDNALKYGDNSRITVRVVRGLHHVRVSVADDGPGMTNDEMERAQGRFWRGPTQQSKPGSGLGLAIVDALAAQCRGHFEMRITSTGGLEASVVLERAVLERAVLERAVLERFHAG